MFSRNDNNYLSFPGDDIWLIDLTEHLSITLVSTTHTFKYMEHSFSYCWNIATQCGPPCQDFCSNNKMTWGLVVSMMIYSRITFFWEWWTKSITNYSIECQSCFYVSGMEQYLICLVLAHTFNYLKEQISTHLISLPMTEEKWAHKVEYVSSFNTPVKYRIVEKNVPFWVMVRKYVKKSGLLFCIRIFNYMT